MSASRFAGIMLTAAIVLSAARDTVIGVQSFGRLAPVGPGKTAPAFDVELLDGGRFAAANLPGKVHVVSFWASWCGYCRNELAQIDRKLLNGYDPGRVAFVAVNREGASYDEARALALQYRNETRMRIPIALDGGAMARAFGVGPIPHTVVFDAAGKIRHVHQGLVSSDKLADEVDALLAE